MLKIILRGISGVGKSTLCNMLADYCKSKNAMVSILSKDLLREEISKNLQITYDYSEKQEIMTSYLYQVRLAAIENMVLDDLTEPLFIICDNTHVNQHQLEESGLLKDKPVIKTIVIEVGSPTSISVKENTTGTLIVQRQREQMEETKTMLMQWCAQNNVPFVKIEARTAIENGLRALCEKIIQLNQN